jgi:hypothetical protein
MPASLEKVGRSEAPALAGETSVLRDAEVAAKHAADLCRQLLIYAVPVDETVACLDPPSDV